MIVDLTIQICAAACIAAGTIVFLMRLYLELCRVIKKIAKTLYG